MSRLQTHPCGENPSVLPGMEEQLEGGFRFTPPGVRLDHEGPEKIREEQTMQTH